MAHSLPVAAPELTDVRARLPALLRDGVRVLELTDPVDVLLDRPESSHALHLIRDATGCGLRIDWALGSAPEDTTPLHHLFPPSSWVHDDAVATVREWQQSYTFGQCFFRVGPSFVTVKDVRPHVEGARMVIDDPDAATFLALAEGGPSTDENGETAAAVTDLREAELCIVGEEGVFVLPYRLRRWPIPFSAI
jgi:uncharacterized protein DUF5825